MPLWNRKRRTDRETADRAERDRAAQEHIARTAAAEAARQRAGRDRAVPTEHRAEAGRREAAIRWNQPTRWLTTVELTPDQRHGLRAPATLADRDSAGRWPGNRGRWSV